LHDCQDQVWDDMLEAGAGGQQFESAISAPLMAPIEIPAIQSGSRPASVNAS
jgi:hypothetical protein